MLAVAVLALLLPPPKTTLKPSMAINLNGVTDWDSELPFSDVFKTSRPWVSQREGEGWGKGPKLDLDDNGYPKRLEPGCFAEAIVLTFPHYPQGDYTLTYKGKGTLTAWGNGKVTSEKANLLTIHVQGDQPSLFIRLTKTDPSDPVRDIHLYLPGTTAQSPTFTKPFLDRWRGVSALRFMDWMDTNGNKTKTWADRPRPDHATWMDRGVPVETMVALCNTLKADGWFCMPHMADDDYIARFAAYVAKNLDPKLKVYVEYSNEVWNASFPQHQYASAQGKALGYSGQPHEIAWKYTAHRSLQIFKIWEKAFGGTQRLVRILPAQAGWTGPAETILAFEDAGHHADALAIAPYIGITPSPGSNPSSDQMANWTVDQVLEQLETKVLPASLKMMADHKALADKYGLDLVAYEGGQHMVGIQGGENNDKLTALLQSANKNPRIGKIYDKYFAGWAKNGGSTFAYFSSTGGWSKWGSWGAFESYDQPASASPKYLAIQRAAQSWGQKIGG